MRKLYKKMICHYNDPDTSSEAEEADWDDTAANEQSENSDIPEAAEE